MPQCAIFPTWKIIAVLFLGIPLFIYRDNKCKHGAKIVPVLLKGII